MYFIYADKQQFGSLACVCECVLRDFAAAAIQVKLGKTRYVETLAMQWSRCFF